MIGVSIMLILVLVGALTLLTLSAEHTFAMIGGQSGVGGGSNGANSGGIDRHLFCNTGVITPICN